MSCPIKYRDGVTYHFDLKERQYVASKKENVFTKRQKTLYHKAYSGLQAGLNKGQMLIFWTLSTEYHQKGYYDKEKKERIVACEEDRVYNERVKKNALARADQELNDDFQVWKKRICRYIQHKKFEAWFKSNFPTVDLATAEGRRVYRAEKNHDWYLHGQKKHWYDYFRYKMCYFKVRTSEGGGVIHGFLRKNRDVPMLDQPFLKRAWDEIHGAEQVEIHQIKPRKGETALSAAQRSALYECGHYFNQQPVVRQSSSYNWIFKGASAVWNRGKTILGIKKRKHEYHPACSCHECKRHDGRKEAYPQKVKENPYVFSKKTDKPNILFKRPSLIKLFMGSRKSLRRDSGYDNALFQWLLLTRNPPVDTRQLKLRIFFR